MGHCIPDAAVSVFAVCYYTFVLLLYLHADVKMDRHVTYTFDSGHALSFHFLLNSRVNAEMCFVKVLISPNRTI